jgi:hypothetical protein
MERKTIGVLVVIMVLAGTSYVIGAGSDPLSELWDAIFGVQDDVQDLSEKMDLLEKIYALEARVVVLEECGECEQGPPGPAGPQGPPGPQGPEGSWGAPDFDSGWKVPDAFGEVHVTHGLGTTDVFVYAFGRADDGRTHQYRYGGDTFQQGIGQETELYHYGAWWSSVNDNEVLVDVYEDDHWWDKVRVLVWRL